MIAAARYDTALPSIIPAAANVFEKSRNRPTWSSTRSATTGMLTRAGVRVSGSA